MKFLIFNYKTTHFQYRSVDEQKGTKIIHPLSCLTVANALVFILPDISLYIYIYVGHQLFSLNDMSMVMELYRQCSFSLLVKIFNIKTSSSFPDSSNW